MPGFSLLASDRLRSVKRSQNFCLNAFVYAIAILPSSLQLQLSLPSLPHVESSLQESLVQQLRTSSQQPVRVAPGRCAQSKHIPIAVMKFVRRSSGSTCLSRIKPNTRRRAAVNGIPKHNRTAATQLQKAKTFSAAENPACPSRAVEHCDINSSMVAS
jgi:hypothetical protein